MSKLTEVSVSKTQLTHQSHHWSITHDHQGMETPKWTSRDEQIKKAWGVIQLFHGPLFSSSMGHFSGPLSPPSLSSLVQWGSEWLHSRLHKQEGASYPWAGFSLPLSQCRCSLQYTDKAVRKSKDIPTFPSPTNYALHSQAPHLESEPPLACPKS